MEKVRPANTDRTPRLEKVEDGGRFTLVLHLSNGSILDLSINKLLDKHLDLVLKLALYGAYIKVQRATAGLKDDLAKEQAMKDTLLTLRNGHWEKLPPNVKAVGQSPEEIFAAWEQVQNKVGDSEMKNIPFGAVAMYTYADKLGCGLQQFMAGARKFKLSEIARADLMAGNRETAEISGIPFMTEAQNEEALAILQQ